MKNKKGFTMIEILAAVTILGILSVTAIVAVNNIIQKAKTNHYLTAEKEFELAAQSYAQQNRSELPKAIGQKKQIYLKNLVDKNYIEIIKDYNGNDCNLEESYVQVFKYSQNDYSYLPYLKCEQYDGEETFTQGSPTISLTITDGNRLKVAEANIKITDQEKLLSWSYIVYREGKEVLNSGSQQTKNYPKKIEKTLELTKYTPGEIKVVVTATNIYGQTTTKSVQKNYYDIEKPVCVYLNENDDPESGVKKDWTTEPRTITVGCDDKDGIGCAREEFSKTFKTSTNVGYVTIKDKKGNSTDCPVTVMIDKKSPTITLKAYKRKSDGTKESTSFASKTLNGKQQSPLTTSYDLSQEVTTGWYNKSQYPHGVYLEVEVSDDVEIDTYKSVINAANQKTSTTEDENLVNIIESKTDIGKTSASYKISVSEDGYRTLAVSTTDLAGNISRMNIILPMDRVAPTTPSVGLYKWQNNSTEPTSESSLATYTPETWSDKNVYTKATNSTDSISGFSKYIYTTTGATENVTEKAGQTRNIKAEGESTIKYAACDVAGNCSTFTQQYIVLVDKTKPSCTITFSGTSGTNGWYKSNATVKINPSDGMSGVAKKGLTTSTTVTYNNTTSETQTNTAGQIWNGYVMDAAGNTNSCDNTVKVDTTKPSCTITKTGTAGNNGWYKSNVTLTLNPSDGLSGVALTALGTSKTPTLGSTKTGTQTENAGIIWYGRVQDNAGNISETCDSGTIMVDTTKPSCTSSGGQSSWTNSDITLTGTCSDLTSGCSTITKKYTTNTNSTTESPGTVTDNAGNSMDCPGNQTVKIDKTAPGAPTSGTLTLSGSSATGSISNVSGSTDSGGSGLKEYRYYVANATGTYANTSSNFKTSTSFTRSCGTNYYLYAIAIDNAGNRSAVAYLANKSDGANQYSQWTSCSKECDGGTQTRTNSCALITSDLSKTCNSRACCSSSSVTYSETSTCNSACGGGNYLRKAYSSYDSSVACPAYDDENGRSCNSGDCCASTRTEWGSWSSCSKSCGGGTKTRSGTMYSTIDGSYCGEDEESESCNTGSCVNHCSDASFSCSSSWQSAGASWGNWCRAGGTTCNASGGYTRICSSSWCSGMTAKEVNNKWGCSYASLCCSCN